MMYKYVFTKQSDQLIDVSMTFRGKEEAFKVQLSLDDESIFKPTDSIDLLLALDIVTIAVAIYTADWHSVRSGDYPLDIYVSIPVYYPERWESDTIFEKLADLLHWYTEDLWHIDFTPCVLEKYGQQQQRLSLSSDREVALWSAGLDAFSGFVRRIENSSTKQFLLFGTGSNPFIHGRQKRLVFPDQGEPSLFDIYSGRVNLQRLSINFKGRSTNTPTNQAFRVRGLAFILLGASIAYLEGTNALHIYENGIGAINLALSSAEVGLDHARSVHPRSLLYCEQFLQEVIPAFRIVNPFWNITKGAMCRFLKSDERLVNLSFDTVTCDRLPRVEGRQCGYCTSCILRRQAFIAAGIEDLTVYASDQGNVSKQNWDIPITAVHQQIHRIKCILNLGDRQNLHREFPFLRESAIYTAEHLGLDIDTVEQEIYVLFQQHVDEFLTAQSAIFEKPMFRDIASTKTTI